MTDEQCRHSELCPERIEALRKSFEGDPRNRTAMNAVTRASVRTVAMNRAAAERVSHTYSHVVKAGSATSQNGSGRCWMFAGLNTMRMAAAESLGVEEFELSQNYLFFWDKVERANYFLEDVLATLDEPTDGRLIQWMLANPVQDGGQWDMFVNLVRKYGVVPKEVMPETESSGSTGMMNDRLTTRLREHACTLRAAHRAGVPAGELRARKAGMLDEVYRITAIHLGLPPTQFLWQWRDKDKAFHRDGVLTPLAFMAKHVKLDLAESVCLIHCPTETTPFSTLYTIDHLGNVAGGAIVRYLNVELDVLKRAAVAQLKDERPVWFGCDVGKGGDRDLGLLDADLYDYASLYQVPFEMSKADRLDYGASAMNHAMVFTGVDLDDQDRPVKWRVENSWGDKGGDKGFMSMTDRWFDEYNYEVVVDRKYLSPQLAAVLETEPVHLPPWHPMGALAR